MRAIQISEFGGPEVLKLVDIPAPTGHAGEVLIEVSACGINYADSHQAENSYLSPQTLPLIPGAEVVGRDASGQRVVALVPGGGYAEVVSAPEALTFPIPDGVSDGAALAAILQGTTAVHLLRTSAHLQSGESVLVHAAAGGVGTIAVQLAKLWGAKVIGSASSADKRELVTSLGADAVLDPAEADLTAAIVAANGGKKVDIVLEMTGGKVFDQSLQALAPFGRLVTFGMASRSAPEPIQAGALMGTSRAVIGFWLVHCMARPDRMIAPQLAELFELMESGKVKAVIGGSYPLSEAKRAHEDLRARKTTGKVFLDPKK